MNQQDRVQQAADALASVSGQSPVVAKRVLAEHDTRDLIASVAAEGVGGGNGATTLQMLGPFTVNWDDPGVNSGKIDVADLAAGTIVIRAAGFITEVWESEVNDGFQFSLEIGNAGDTENLVVTDYPTSPGTASSWIEGSATAPDGLTTMVGRTTGSGWKLRASAWVNGSGALSSGAIDWYALAYVPA